MPWCGCWHAWSASAWKRPTCWRRRCCRGTLRDRRAVARYAGLTGSPDESGAKRREKGLARAGNARVRRGMIQFAWRFLWLQKDSALAQWYRQRAEAAPKMRKTLIVALARKLLIALWRLARDGVVPEVPAPCDQRNRRTITSHHRPRSRPSCVTGSR